MKINERCAACLYDKQVRMTNDQMYLAEVREILKNCGEDASAPYAVYLFDQAYERRFGKKKSYKEIKKKYNDMMLSIEAAMRQKIVDANDPIATAFMYARIGNFIDFGAMVEIDDNKLMQLLDEAYISDSDLQTLTSFKKQCENVDKFLLLADNCGEIVLDKLFLEQLQVAFPHLKMYVMVRGAEVLNDVTAEDAVYVGVDKIATIVPNGTAVAGTVYGMISDDAKAILNQAGVILSKGQGNYESISHQGRHIFYSFLCKCDLFTERFNVPRYTGMFIEEWDRY